MDNINNALLERVLELVSHKSKNKSDFARLLCMDQTTVNNQLLGKRSISIDLIYRALNSFDDISSDWLLLGKGNMIKEDINKENTEIISLKKELEESKKEIFRLEGENSIMREQLGLSQRKNGKTA